jgi:CBS-domain-containing membrane protein
VGMWTVHTSLPVGVYSSIHDPLISETRTFPSARGCVAVGVGDRQRGVVGVGTVADLPGHLPWGEMNRIRLLEASATVMVPDFSR